MNQEAPRSLVERLRQLESVIPDLPAILVFWRLAEDWPVEFVSENINRLGYRALDFVSGQIRWSSIVHPGDRDRMLAECADHIAAGHDQFVQNYRLIQSNGDFLYVRDSSRVMRDELGAVYGLLGFIVDVSSYHQKQEELEALLTRRTAAIEEQRIWLEREIMERKRVEEALRDSENRLELAVRTAPIALFTQDKSLRYTWVFNPPPGIRLDQLIGRTDVDIFGAEGEPIREFKERSLKENKLIQQEVAVHINGALHHYNVAVEPMRTSNGHVIGLICAAIDISPWKKAELARAEIDARYRAIVDAFDGYIYICSPDYKVEFMNEPLIKRTGRMAIGENCYSVLHGLNQKCPWCQANKVFGGQKVSWEVQSPLDRRWYYIVNTPIKRPDGKFSKLTAYVDITERKAAEEKREQLARAHQRAQLLERLAHLMGNIAHHFNNQLTVIMGHADFASEDLPEYSPTRLALSEIKVAAERAARLTSAMLTCSGNTFSQPGPATINDLVNAARPLLEVAAAPHIKIDYCLSDACLSVNVDRVLIQQAMLNIINNAVDAIGNQPGCITISTGAVDLDANLAEQIQPSGGCPPGRYAFIRISDSGGGMPQDMIPRLFEPFASTKGVGRGLGIPMTLGIMSVHRGGMLVESESAVGCTVTLYLPETQA